MALETRRGQPSGDGNAGAATEDVASGSDGGPAAAGFDEPVAGCGGRGGDVACCVLRVPAFSLGCRSGSFCLIFLLLLYAVLSCQDHVFTFGVLKLSARPVNGT